MDEDIRFKHGKCVIRFGECRYDMDKDCFNERKKAFNYDHIGFAEWVGEELYKDAKTLAPSSSFNERFDETSSIFYIRQVFEKNNNIGGAIMDLKNDLAKNGITLPMIHDIICEAAKKFNVFIEEK